ncbi:MAG: TRAM domain-containing protein [Armatimonadota bacterium]|nr:TRAM domain-containing protein [Armatimonadota bacterium]
MRDSVMRAVGALLGGVVGYQIAVVAGEYWPSVAAAGFRPQALGVIVGGLVGLLAVPPLSRAFVAAMAWVLRPLEGLSLHDLLLGGLGLGVGLMLALFVGYLLEGMPLIGPYVRLVAGLVLGYVGLHVALQRRDELAGILRRQGERPAGERRPARPKLLDTSVIIDGRIADICRAGFLEGPLLVPRSVLTELQRIADSADSVRRNRGRRGLDILNRLRRELESVQVIEDVGDALDVDAQLIALARAHDAWLVTNDFNLSKVAELQGVRALNVNELAQAVRPAVLPGEELTVQVIRDGKEAGQGVAFLDDGTMIVVEGGKRLIGETSEVVVTSVLQTSAGRMIFARPKSSEPTGSSSLPRR